MLGFTPTLGQSGVATSNVSIEDEDNAILTDYAKKIGLVAMRGMQVSINKNDIVRIIII